MESPTQPDSPARGAEHNDDLEDFIDHVHTLTAVHRAQMSANMAALNHCLNSRQRSFVAVMYHTTIGGPMEVPEFFSRRVRPVPDLRWKVYTSEVSAEVSWDSDPRESDETWFTFGWPEFCRAVHLVEGDCISVELMNKRERSIKVTSFRFRSYITA